MGKIIGEIIGFVGVHRDASYISDEYVGLSPVERSGEEIHRFTD